VYKYKAIEPNNNTSTNPTVRVSLRDVILQCSREF
jgi:hypothetical protein